MMKMKTFTKWVKSILQLICAGGVYCVSICVVLIMLLSSFSAQGQHWWNSYSIEDFGYSSSQYSFDGVTCETLPDGSLLSVLEVKNTSTLTKELQVVKLSIEGDILFQNSFSGLGNIQYSRTSSKLLAMDSIYFVVSYKNLSPIGRYYILKLDSNGNELLRDSVDVNGATNVYDLGIYNSQNLAILGNTSAFGHVVFWDIDTGFVEVFSGIGASGYELHNWLSTSVDTFLLGAINTFTRRPQMYRYDTSGFTSVDSTSFERVKPYGYDYYKDSILALSDLFTSTSQGLALSDYQDATLGITLDTLFDLPNGSQIWDFVQDQGHWCVLYNGVESEAHFFDNRIGSTYLGKLNFTNLGLSSVYAFDTRSIDTGYYFVATTPDLKEVHFFNTSKSGEVFSTQLQGLIFWDENENCISELDEKVLRNWVIEFENSGTHFYGFSDSNGVVSTGLPEGLYAVHYYPPGPIWRKSSCAADTILVLDSVLNYFEFPQKETANSALLQVDISAPFLRRCFESTYTITYRNLGNETRNFPFIQFHLDPDLSVVSSSVPIDTLGGPYTGFQLDSIQAGEVGQIQVDVLVDCDSTVLGQTHCTEVVFIPRTYFYVDSPGWDRSEISLTGICEGDSSQYFVIYNGGSDMSINRSYKIVQDDLIFIKDQYQVDSASFDTLVLPADGSTMRMIADQDPLSVRFAATSTAIEGCGGVPHIGYHNQFPEGDDEPFVSRDCQQNIGSYDPNSITVYPYGVSSEKYIQNEDRLKYHIQFQNTGTDTAFKVIVNNTFPEEIDLSTLRLGSSSHPFTFQLNNRQARWIFDPILLPDSGTDLQGSQGFITYEVYLHEPIDTGTVVEDSASIYFDFNPPIYTNIDFNTIGLFDDFVKVSVEEIDGIELEEILTYPNPAHEKCILVFGSQYRQVQLQVFDINSRVVYEESFNETKSIEISLSDFAAGIYPFLVKSGTGIMLGKIIKK